MSSRKFEQPHLSKLVIFFAFITCLFCLLVIESPASPVDERETINEHLRKGEYAEAIVLLDGLVKGNDSWAIVKRADLYRKGFGGDPDYALAFELYERVPDEENSKVGRALILLEGGYGIEQDLEAALRLTKNMTSPYAKFCKGLRLLEKGKKESKDNTRGANRWFDKAVEDWEGMGKLPSDEEQRFGEALSAIGDLYRWPIDEGGLLKINLEAIAAAADPIKAREEEIARKRKQETRGREYLKRSFELGNPAGTVRYAICLHFGYGGEAEPKEAFRIWEEAGELGRADALNLLAIYNFLGQTPKSTDTEAKLQEDRRNAEYQKAAKWAVKGLATWPRIADTRYVLARMLRFNLVQVGDLDAKVVQQYVDEYAEGLGVTIDLQAGDSPARNLALATVLYDDAVQISRHRDAMTELGVVLMYEAANRNEGYAFDLFSEVAALKPPTRSSVEALYHMAVAYKEGKGTEKDLDEAEDLLLGLFEDYRYGRAAVELARWYVDRDGGRFKPDEVIPMLNHGALLGDAHCMFALGQIYVKSREVERGGQTYLLYEDVEFLFPKSLIRVGLLEDGWDLIVAADQRGLAEAREMAQRITDMRFREGEAARKRREAEKKKDKEGEKQASEGLN